MVDKYSKPVVKAPKPEVPEDDAVIKAWKQGTHIKAAKLIIAGGSQAALIKAIPEDAALIEETVTIHKGAA